MKRIEMQRIMEDVEGLEVIVKKAEKSRQQLMKIREECSHDIVVLSDFWGGNDINAKCIFCGKEFFDKRELSKTSKVVDMTGIDKLMRDDKYELAINVCKRMLALKPIVTVELIVEELEEEIKEF